MKLNLAISCVLVLCLGLLGGLGQVMASGAGAAGQTGVPGTAKADNMDACVAPTPFMRRNHFELIKHQRDITVHQGIRKTDNSLHGCVDCHVRMDQRGKPVPVNAPGEFCAGCHQYTGASLDCFSCHATTPTGN